MEARFAMWVHGVSAYPQRTAGDAGRDGPLVQVREEVDGPGVPWSDIVGLREGGGATFRGKAFHKNWFHFAIPVPVIMPVFQPANQHYNLGQGIHLEKVFVLFQNYVSARGGALTRIEHVHVWDGGQTRYDTRLVPNPNPVGPISNPVGDVPPDPEPLPYDPFGGNHLDIQGGWNAWTIFDGVRDFKPLIRFGLCISVYVHFSAEIDIRFAAAGADFILDVP
ncbi:MAG TPA: hypothetical protein VJM08_18485 [Anaerolineales bacterium]|nr:hypothetical protein [Anaerolineales bacterium]